MLLSRRILLAFFILAGLVLYSCDNDLLNPNAGLRLYKRSRLPSTQNFYSIEFINDKTGWAIGKKGTIYFTEDGGDTWQKQNSGIDEALSEIQFIDNQNGWIAGENNLLATTDGGKNWNIKLSNVPFSRFAAIDFIYKNTGWVSGSWDGKIYHTEDGGNSWQIGQIDTLGRVVALSFSNSSTGFAFNNIRGIHKTIDAGKTWSDIENPRFCSTLHFINDKIGYAGNNVMPSSVMKDSAQIFKTYNGGATWSKQNISPIASAVWKIRFTNFSVGFAIAGGISGFSEKGEDWIECGNLFYTLNGGNNWVKVNSFSYNAIDFDICGRNKLCALTKEGEICFFEVESL